MTMTSEMLRSTATVSAYKCCSDSPENRVYERHRIEYNFVVLRFSDSDNFETDADYTGVFDLYFMV